MAYATLDGNDVVTVAEETGRLIDDMRTNPAPALVEAVTYRWRGHVGPDENIDVGLRRSKAEVDAWKQRDPVARLARAMMTRGDFDQSALDTLKSSVDDQVASAKKQAHDAPWPDQTLLLDAVYAKS